MSQVLVVDDEPTLRELVAEVLQDEGYTVVMARNGREALDVVARENPDLVLMDVMMPVMDGRAAYRALRQMVNGRAMPIVLMSASLSLAELDPGVNGFLRKPFDINRLIELVQRVLSAD